MLAFDTDLAPIVGQQVTLTSGNGATVGPRITLMLQRAAAGECDAVVKGNLAGVERGWVCTGSGCGGAGSFQSDRTGEPLLTDAQLRAQANTAGQELTYTAVPVGSGIRIGIDRDEDGFPDRTELDTGSDPADPASVPGSSTTTTTTVTTSTTSSSTTSTTAPTTSTTSTTTTSRPPTTTTSSTTSTTSAPSTTTSTTTTATASTTTTTRRCRGQKCQGH